MARGQFVVGSRNEISVFAKPAYLTTGNADLMLSEYLQH
jgi:hypothetical protein